ncbi:Uncharacterised protein [Mycobacteroides abscessus subsp. abscessus]|nr:Uncharacterised protein [Mycobacteroides abscessus subsp. abscessus]
MKSILHRLAQCDGGLVGGGLADIADQTQHHVGGLVVGALTARGRDRLTPHVHDELNMLLVRVEQTD